MFPSLSKRLLVPPGDGNDALPSEAIASASRRPARVFDDVVRAGVYLTSMSDFIAMNGIYAKYFSQPFPARTTIAAAALPL